MTGGHSFAHFGDSVTFQGFERAKLDVFVIPISGEFTASPKSASIELNAFGKPFPRIIPIHWLLRSSEIFCEKLSSSAEDTICYVLKEGDILSL